MAGFKLLITKPSQQEAKGNPSWERGAGRRGPGAAARAPVSSEPLPLSATETGVQPGPQRKRRGRLLPLHTETFSEVRKNKTRTDSVLSQALTDTLGRRRQTQRVLRPAPRKNGLFRSKSAYFTGLGPSRAERRP